MNIGKDIDTNSVSVSMTLVLPRGDTATSVPFKGALLYNIADSSLYIGNGTAWTNIQGLSDCIENTQSNTSVCVTDSPINSVIMTVNNNLRWTLNKNGGIEHGFGNIASGTNSFSSGQSNTSSGVRSHTEGFSCIASQIDTHAEGILTEAGGPGSHSEGNRTHAMGDASHAEGGSDTFANGSASHAEGLGCITEAAASASHVEGNQCKTKSLASHAQGVRTEASGIGGHTEGYSDTIGNIKTSADGAHAEGRAVGSGIIHASNTGAHVEGYVQNGESNIASGIGSHVEGRNCQSLGLASHAGGQNATAANNNNYCWSDGSVFATTGQKQYAVKATGDGPLGVIGTGIYFDNGAVSPVTSAIASHNAGNDCTWSYIDRTIVPGTWAVSAPTNIADALSRLADRVFALGGPIP